MASIDREVPGFTERDNVFSVNLGDKKPFDRNLFDTLVRGQNKYFKDTDVLISKFVVKGDLMVVIPFEMLHADVPIRTGLGELLCAGAVEIRLTPPKTRTLSGYSRSLEMFLPREESEAYKKVLKEILGKHFRVR